MTIAATVQVITKVAICLYFKNMVLTTTIAEYKLEFAYSEPNVIAVTITIVLAAKPNQIKFAT